MSQDEILMHLRVTKRRRSEADRQDRADGVQ